jgi:cell division protein ZapD
VSSYEFPFNERIRTYLRLEDLFVKVLHHVNIGHEYNHHIALISMLQMLDVIDRADLKMELLQELERQKTYLSYLRNNPNISTQALNDTIEKLERCIIALKEDASKAGQLLRENEWLMSIKKRAMIPGGVCEFDLPVFHHWLNLSEERRKSDFDIWLARLMPIYQAIEVILHIVRGSGELMKHTAKQGVFQQMLSGAKPAQLLRIELDDGLCFPEISANKYAISIRFYSLDFVNKAKLCEKDVAFSMSICNL